MHITKNLHTIFNFLQSFAVELRAETSDTDEQGYIDFDLSTMQVLSKCHTAVIIFAPAVKTIHTTIC